MKTFKLICVFVTGLVFAAQAQADDLLYLKIEGVKGSVITKPFAGTIGVLSSNWALARIGSGVCNQTEMSFTKYADSATPALLKNLASNDTFKLATLFITRMTGNGPTAYLRFEFMRPYVSSYALNSAGGSSSVEGITLGFERAIGAQRVIKADGSLSGWQEFDLMACARTP